MRTDGESQGRAGSLDVKAAVKEAVGDALIDLGDGEYITTFDEEPEFSKVVEAVTEAVMACLHPEPRSMAPSDLFPADGHRYFTDEHIEKLRELAIDGNAVTLPALTVMELVCDWRNMASDLDRLEQRASDAQRLRDALHAAHDRLNDHFGHADAPYTPWVLELLAEMKDAFDGR